jgi:Protein of unknown function (DUF1501)
MRKDPPQRRRLRAAQTSGIGCGRARRVWDTHASQIGEYSALTRNLRAFDRTMAALKGALGAAWRDTAVIVVAGSRGVRPREGLFV